MCHQSDQPKQSAYSDAFDALECVLETPVKVKYKRRLDEDYDLNDSPTFITWKKLRTAASIVQSLPSELGIQEQPISTSAPWPNATSAPPSSISPALEEISNHLSYRAKLAM